MIEFDRLISEVQAAQKEVTNRNALAHLSKAATALGLAKHAEENYGNPDNQELDARMRATYAGGVESKATA